MNNVEMKVTGSKLQITIDLAKPGKVSSTGKSLLVASTGGYVPVPGLIGINIGLNVTKPLGQQVAA